MGVETHRSHRMNPTDSVFLSLLDSLDTFADEGVRSAEVHGKYREIRNEFVSRDTGCDPRSIAAASDALGSALKATESAYARALSDFDKLQGLVPEEPE
jgi:hypothetical protein